MALWNPPNDVGLGEYIGRRLFSRQKLAGAKDQQVQANTYDLNHFLETRDPGEVSLDRLGPTSIDTKVRRHLEPRAAAAGAQLHPPAPFIGWAIVRARDLAKPPKGPQLPVVASPIEPVDGDELSSNIFHAHVVRPATLPPEDQAYFMAVHLRVIFEKNYKFQEADAPDPPWHLRLWVWLTGSLPHF